MKARIKDYSYGYDGKQKLLLELIGDFRESYEKFKDKDIDVEIDYFSEKRSLTANSYFWVLCDKVAKKTKKTKIKYYREAIKNIGGNVSVVCVKDEAVDKLICGWEHNGLGWICETFPSKIDGCTNVFLYYGSSTYDKQTMARLINYVIDDCNEYGIETYSKEELDSLLNSWRGINGK